MCRILLLCCLSVLVCAPVAAAPVDDYHSDDASKCRAKPMKGALALEDWLDANVRGASWGILRCEHGSLHGEGRAVDWHLDAREPRDRRAGERLIRRLLATDAEGNPHALARRMGVQEIIWDCESWWAGAEEMGPYSLCYDKRGRKRRKLDPTQAHVDHVHIGLSLAGARMRTSFWAR